MSRSANFTDAGGFVMGDPPDDICSTRGLSPARARLARYLAWQRQIHDEHDKLEAKKANLLELMNAPATTESLIAALVKRTAAVLSGRADNDDGAAADRKQLDERLSTERHQAQAATEALKDIETELDRARLRVQRIGQRQAEFINAALIEAADQVGLGEAYLQKVTELRELVQLIFGLADVAGGYGAGLPMPKAVELPSIKLPSIANEKAAAFWIEPKGSTAWADLAKALCANPYLDAARFLPRLKG